MEKEQSKESLPYWYETQEWKDFSKLAENNFGGKQPMETLEESLLQIRKTPMTFEPKQERMYSEEEVIKIVEKSRVAGLTAEYLLLTEQFKKK